MTNGGKNRFAARVIENAKGSPVSFGADEVSLELYWKGFRDYSKKKDVEKPSQEETAARYRERFRGLRGDVEEYNRPGESGRYRFRGLRSHNYTCPEAGSKYAESLYDNLLNTEIDIVLSTPDCLLIGEAKHEETFGANSEHVLAHQLIRQYVMASILVNIMGDKPSKEIVPFVVCDSKEKMERTAQVQFLHHQKWLCLDNVFSWEDIRRFAKE
jgi:hypothetical protein